MPISFKVDNVEISALRDRVMFNSFAGNKSYVVKGFGEELNVLSSGSSFSVTLGTGEAVICGGSMLCDGETPSLTLPANQSGYLVIRVDLSQTGDNICQFKNVSSLVQGDINNGTDLIYDLPLFSYTTNAQGVSQIVDERLLIESSNDGFMKLVENPVNNNILVSDANGQAKISNKTLNNIYSAGSNVSISNNTINAQVLNAFNLQTLPDSDLNNVKSVGYFRVPQNTTNAPRTNGGVLFVEKLYDDFLVQTYIFINTDVGTSYVRYYSLGTWGAWTKILENKVSVLNNNNLNSITTTGFYYVTGGTTARSFPSGVTEGWLLVFNSDVANNDNANVKQILYRFDSTFTQTTNRSTERNSEVYVRSMVKGSSYYGEWVKVSNNYYNVGDTISFVATDNVYLTYSGVIGNSASQIWFSIPLSKPCLRKYITFSKLIISLYETNAKRFITNVDVATDPNYTIKAYVHDDNIKLQITKNSDFISGKTNIPITIMIQQATATIG